MINAVLDISNIFYRSMYITGGYGKKGYTFDSQKEIDELVRKVAIDVSFTLRQINASRVIFAIDSRSWRKDIEIEENEGYKSHRKKADYLNWDNIYSAMDDFCSIMNDKGLITSKIEGAEADDLMCLWKDELLFNQKQHVILVSGDEDIRQLVSFNPYEQGEIIISAVFNPFTQGKNSKKKLFVPSVFNEWLEKEDETVDIFNRNIDSDKEAFIKLTNDNQVVFEVLDGEEVALRKIFCGDTGDNVPAIYSWKGQTKKGDPKDFRITEAKYKKIIETIRPVNLQKNFSNRIDYIDLSDHLDLIYKELQEISGQKPSFKMKDRLKRQIKLVVLDSLEFPENIVNKFKEQIEDNLAKVPDKISGWHMNSLLEGTRYIDENYQRSKNEASIFKDIDKISKQLF